MSGILLVPLLLIANGLRAAESQFAPPRSGSMSVNAVVFHVFLEDAARGPITLRVNRASAGHENAVLLEDVQPGALMLNLSALEPDLYLLWATSPGYATALVSLNIKRGEATVSSPQVTLYRTRYAIIRYSVNRTGTRALTGPGVEQGRCAVAASGNMPFFAADWRVAQRSQELYLDFHRQMPAYGFAAPRGGTSFEALAEGPPNEAYKCEGIRATPGLVLFCRVLGNVPTDQCYGKLLVEGVTERPPADVELIEASW